MMLLILSLVLWCGCIYFAHRLRGRIGLQMVCVVLLNVPLLVWWNTLDQNYALLALLPVVILMIGLTIFTNTARRPPSGG